MFRFRYSDHGYLRPVDSWDAVDVWGQDGMLHHGTIVDIEPEGLIVDFGCPGQRRQLVKYGEGFGYYRMSYPAEVLRPGCAVEVLLRLDRTSPWIWRPATLVCADITRAGKRTLALVDVQLGGVERREVVEFHQIRAPPAPAELQSRVLVQDLFVVTAVPADPLSTDAPMWEAFCHRMSLYGRCRPVSDSNGELRVLHRKWTGCIRRNLYHVRYNVKKARESFAAGVHSGVMWMEDGVRCHWPLCGGLVEVEQHAVGWGRILQDVHHYVLDEVFSYLSTVERVSQRRVCRRFDVLMSRTLTEEIRLTNRQCSLGAWACRSSSSQSHEDYPFCAPLLKCLTPATRRIILTNAGPDTLSSVLSTWEVCRQLGQCAAGQQVLIAAGQCDVEDDYYLFFERVEDLAAVLTDGWCRQLLLKKCTMSTKLPGACFSGALRGSSTPEGPLQEDLCQLIERQLPAVDVQRMTEWIAQAMHDQLHGELPELGYIADILYEFTSYDPREGNVYADFEWSLDSMDAWNVLDVSKLSRLAQYAVSRRLPVPHPAAEGL